MVAKRIFEEREHAMEANYFRQQDAKLIDKLRQDAKLDEIATALRDKLELDNPDLLIRVRELGITAETVSAFFLAPLVQVAWAGGSVGSGERQAVLRAAKSRGIEANSPAYSKLREWLLVAPSNALFDTAVEVIKYGFAVLPPREVEERIERVINACHDVAVASGNVLAQALGLGLGSGISRAESEMLNSIASKLRSRD